MIPTILTSLVSEKVKSPKSPGIIKKESEPIKLSKFTDDDEDDDFFGDFDDIETDNLTLKQEERDDDAFRYAMYYYTLTFYAEI